MNTIILKAHLFLPFKLIWFWTSQLTICMHAVLELWRRRCCWHGWGDQEQLDSSEGYPKKFARKPRSIWDIDHWKATEYRVFVILWQNSPQRHFTRSALCTFSYTECTLCILVRPDLVLVHREYAHELLLYFVACSWNIYGREFLIYNVHSLLHIASDAARHGSLDKFSAFCFENYLHQLKRSVRSSKSPLVQVVKRLHENDCASKPAPLPKLRVSSSRLFDRHWRRLWASQRGQWRTRG